MTTSTTPALPPPPPTQSIMNPELVARLTALEKRNTELEHAFTIQNNTTNNLASRIFILEHCDLDFRDLSEIEMKEMLHQRNITTDTRDTPSSSSKQQSVSQSEQPTDDIPTPDDGHISDFDDNDNAHVPKIKPRAEWLKPVPKDERPALPEPDWVIPANDLLEAENN
ncbi:hypothetical protein Tco_1436183 [Tanacetum coccineum]